MSFFRASTADVVARNELRIGVHSEHVEQLFHDYTEAFNSDDEYFLGTIVTIPRGNAQLEIVDGQQRLATTALLLAAIRDYLKEQGETVLVDAINTTFLFGYDRPRRSVIPKLALNTQDNELFKAIVSGELVDSEKFQRDSHEKLIAAYDAAKQHVRNVLAALDPKTHGDLLERWVSFIEYQALAVLLRVPADADAYKMFETLNDRGLRPAQEDLIKNYLFGRASDRFDEVQAHWSYMRGALETVDDPDITITFLRHALVVQNGYLSARKVYEEVEKVARSPQSTVTFVMNLDAVSGIYVATFNPNHERWNDYPSSVRSAVAVFNELDIKPLRALIFAVAARFEKREAAVAYSFLIALGVRLLVAATVRSGSVEEPLSGAARDIYAGDITTTGELKEQLKGLTPGDQQFGEAFEIAHSAKAKFARYYLRSLEMTVQGNSEPWFLPQSDAAIVNLEHVLPEKPEGNWPQFTDEDVAQYAKRLGNLVLMRASDNSHARSAAFADKKPIYSDSPYELTSQVAEVPEWTIETIRERQKLLAELAVKTWPTK